MSTRRTILFYNLADPRTREKALPFIKAAKKIFNRVVLITHLDTDEFDPWIDKHWVCHYSNYDHLVNLVRNESPDMITTVNSRLGVLVARLNEDMGLEWVPVDSAKTLIYKDKWYNFLKSEGLPSPQFTIPFTEEHFLDLPTNKAVLLKPTFGTGSANIFKFSCINQLRQLLDTEKLVCFFRGIPLNLDTILKDNNSEAAPVFGRWMICDYIEHEKQFGLELLISKHQIDFAFCTQIYVREEQTFTTLGHIGPVPFPDALKAQWQMIVQKLRLSNCNLTPDQLLMADGRYCIIDANLNVGSEGLLELLRALGVDYPDLTLRTFLGDPVKTVKLQKHFALSRPIGSSKDKSFEINTSNQLTSLEYLLASKSYD